MKDVVKELKHANAALTLKLALATVAMFGFGYALVPLYDVMCDVLGINGKPDSTAAIQPSSMVPDTSRTVRVEFMAHMNQGLAWEFEPKQVFMDVHPGQVIQTAYVAKNLSAETVVGQAVPSVSPGLGAKHFNKIECFCFNQQPLDSQQTAELPLIFYIEPELPDSIHTVTLSYTLYDITETASTLDLLSTRKAARDAAATQRQVQIQGSSASDSQIEVMQ